jgi:tRNA-uridine 2-sulfurtransferase
MVKAIALFSGGLDSMLAAKLIQKQNIEVVCLTFTTPFFNASKAQSAAKHLNLSLFVEDITSEHLQILKAPRYGYGKNINPCIDCHILMLKTAGKKMEAEGADFILTGEVLGQRPMSQTKQSLYLVAKNSGYADYILRPLSAQLLPPIKAEREDKINRSLLLNIAGRGRKEQIFLAREFGISNYPPPAGGCLLTDPIFSRRLCDLITHQEDRHIRDYELLKYGRHLRTPEGYKIIVGRNKADNEQLRKLSIDADLVCNMADFPGPYVLLPYSNESALPVVAAVCVRYSDAPSDIETNVVCCINNKTMIIKSKAAERDDCVRWTI